ncbi:UPF0175 family protein [Thermococcus argininiproducens]|uniref:UPF0175 family protein n=1 Tax=Thermococcus argininiproducens TaxID=2866384 RepID=A0A9E7SD52_9EURY|nr:UPF0175 family protein [Thermococcus argininiproducens]USH00461.1 UPF0175 family protein [Thermococcus argininiproducens]
MEESWIVSELEKIALFNPERVLKVLKKDKELFWEIVISAYLDTNISLSKAAELLGVTRDELIEEFRKRGIPVRKLSREDAMVDLEVLNCL